MKKIVVFLMVSWCLGPLSAQTFQFKYQEGAQYKALGTNHQKVYFDGQLINQSEMVTKITYKITQVKDGQGLHDGSIQVTTERQKGYQGVYGLEDNYSVLYWRDAGGKFTMVKEDYMPVVRHVPSFPSRELKPGDRWTAPGEEVHDMRRNFGIAKPMRIPMNVQYEYVGPKDPQNPQLHTFRIEYHINARTGYNYPGRRYPVLMGGWSKQILTWDAAAGQPVAYEEEYSLSLSLSDGHVYEFTGTADARITEMPVMNRQDLTRDIKKDLAEQGLGNLEVKPTDKGVTITLENIQFEPESDQLKPSEQAKIRTIGDILKKYPQRDILIEGHTAFFGTREGRQKLSEDRAAAVGNYLLSLGVRTQEQMLFKGWGADKPLGDNRTEAGMAKNRRVEITILEN